MARHFERQIRVLLTHLYDPNLRSNMLLGLSSSFVDDVTQKRFLDKFVAHADRKNRLHPEQCRRVEDFRRRK